MTAPLFSHHFESLSKLGQKSDLEFAIHLTLRRGIIRSAIVTASCPQGGDYDAWPCGMHVDSFRDLAPCIESLAIESAVRWSERPLFAETPTRISWYDPHQLLC